MEEKITFDFFEDSIEESTNKIAKYFHLCGLVNSQFLPKV